MDALFGAREWYLFLKGQVLNKDVKGANIFAGSNYYKLSCSLNKEEGRIVCVAPGMIAQYAGQTGIIYLARQMFYVTIPDIRIRQSAAVSCGDPDEDPCPTQEPGNPGNPGTPPEACTPPQVLGANVEFEDAEGFTTVFVSGDSLQAVNAHAIQMMANSNGFWEAFQIVSGLQCGNG